MAKQTPTDISMTTFIDFVMKSGTPKFTVVRNYKHQPPYHPSSDYYKALRDGIVAVHQNGNHANSLDQVVANAHPNRMGNFSIMASAYKRWLGRKQMTWFDPTTAVWQSGGVTVNVNPELGLEINGIRHQVKLYFKADPLTKARADILLELMANAIGTQPNAVMAILDIRQHHIFTTQQSLPQLNALLMAEAAYWAALWPHV